MLAHRARTSETDKGPEANTTKTEQNPETDEKTEEDPETDELRDCDRMAFPSAIAPT